MSCLSAYTDQHSDSETGLMYYNSRYYDTDLKRFTSVDPWSGNPLRPQTLNKYTYVNNNPLKYTDPSGNCDNTESCVETAKGFGSGAGNRVVEYGQALSNPWSTFKAAVSGTIDNFSNAGEYLGELTSNPIQTISDTYYGTGQRLDGFLEQSDGQIGSVVGGATIDAMASAIGLKGTQSLMGKAPVSTPGYTLSSHANDRMNQYGITTSQIEETLQTKPFTYNHNGQDKVGYRNQNSGLFIAQDPTSKNILTVIPNTSKNYVTNKLNNN